VGEVALAAELRAGQLNISYSRLVAALDVATGAGASRIGIVDEDTEQLAR
jgi:hypothetical protein